MISIEEVVELRQDADEAFRFIADFRNLPKWDPGIDSAAKTDGGDSVEVGSEFDVVARFMGRLVPMRYRVAAYDASTRSAVLVGEAATLVATDRIDIAPRGDGARVHWRAEFEFKGPLGLGERLMKPLMDRLGRKAMDGLRKKFA